MKAHNLVKTGALLLLSAAVLPAAAQDTTRNRQVSITSAFRPELKEASKIRFSAAPPPLDSVRSRLQYSVPNQNLLFGFQPGSLKPLALGVDTGGTFANSNYIKLGYGNFNTPFAQAGLSIGNNQTAGLAVFARHTGSKGKLPYQDFTSTRLEGNAFFRTDNNLEWNARVNGTGETHYRYGFRPLPPSTTLREDSVRLRYTSFGGRLGFRNFNRTEYDLSYAPQLSFSRFYDDDGNTEGTALLNLPLSKRVGDKFVADLSLTGQLSRYKSNGKGNLNNNFLSVAPSIIYGSEAVTLRAGINPTWYGGGNFKLFPNVMTEFFVPQSKFSVQLGWIGYMKHAGFQQLAEFNPWIWAPDTVYNTRIEERYAGIKGAAGDHLAFSAKVGFHRFQDQPLFVNDTSLGYAFVVSRESRMNVLHIGGEVGYTVGDKFSWNNSFALNNYNGLQDNERAWGLLPVELRSTLRVQVLRDLYVNGSLFAFDGAWASEKGDRINKRGAADLSAGLEFTVVKNIRLWAQFNNILNKPYERWNRYPVYGFNFLGGVVFSLAQNNP